MQRFHRWLGAALVIVFIFTGQYMDKVYAHLHGMATGPRLLYRTRHIYVLFAALLHLALGAYLVRASTRGARVVQAVGSTLLGAGSALIVVSFFYDPQHADLVPLNLVFSRFGIYAVASGVVLHALAGARRHTSAAATTADSVGGVART